MNFSSFPGFFLAYSKKQQDDTKVDSVAEFMKDPKLHEVVFDFCGHEFLVE